MLKFIVVALLFSLSVWAEDAEIVSLDKPEKKSSPTLEMNEFTQMLVSKDMEQIEKAIAADPEIAKKRSDNGLYPLHWIAGALQMASQEKNFASTIAFRINVLRKAEYLIEHGADVDALTLHGGYTPLQMAVLTGHTDYATLLLKHGANLRITNDDDCSAMDFACVKLLEYVDGQSVELRHLRMVLLLDEAKAPLHKLTKFLGYESTIASIRDALKKEDDKQALEEKK